MKLHQGHALKVGAEILVCTRKCLFSAAVVQRGSKSSIRSNTLVCPHRLTLPTGCRRVLRWGYAPLRYRRGSIWDDVEADAVGLAMSKKQHVLGARDRYERRKPEGRNTGVRG